MNSAPWLSLSLVLGESPVGAAAEGVVVRLLYQLIVILVVTRVVVILARRFLGQTDVSGEILAGLLLGPSLFGAIAPEAMHELFHPSTSIVFVGLAQIGLIFLMFQIGQEFEFRSALLSGRRSAAVISLFGIVVPFALGYFTAPFFYERLAAPQPPLLAFRLFFAVAMSITAIPILGRIFMELGLSHTRTAALTISAAAIDDVLGWLLLGVVSLLVAAEFSFDWLAVRLLGLGVYVALVFFVARPILRRYVERHIQRHGRLTHVGIATVLIALFVSASITSNLSVFAIIGGFVIGVSVHDSRPFVTEWRTRIAPLVNTFFLPIFFAFTGLRTDVGTLDSLAEIGLCALVCVVAFAGKFGGAYLAARLVGEDNRSALTIATCMNTRALMELVALNIGYDLGVVPASMFTKLVIMALVSTYMATPLIRRLMRAERRDSTVPKAVSLRMDLPLSGQWEDIERVRQNVLQVAEGALRDRDRCHVVAMTVAELLENALKHGPARPTNPPVLDLQIEGDVARVRVTSDQPPEPEKLRVLEERVRWLSACASARDAFETALQRAHGEERGFGLGLPRIAYEGDGTFHVAVVDGRVSVLADLFSARPCAGAA